MGRFGFQEILLIVAVALVFFGGTRLPALGKGLGEGIRNFKKGLRGGDDSEDEDEGEGQLPEADD